MPSKIVDLSARSKIIRDEPFHVHFWECTPKEFLAQLKNPRKFLTKMGVELPADCRIETTIENHDWLEEHTSEAPPGTHVAVAGVGFVIAIIGGALFLVPI